MPTNNELEKQIKELEATVNSLANTVEQMNTALVQVNRRTQRLLDSVAESRVDIGVLKQDILLNAHSAKLINV